MTDRLGRGGDAGSATLELAIVAPALLVLLSLVIAAGRIVSAGSAVEQAAAAGARAASIARDARQAQVQAQRTIEDSLNGQGLECARTTSAVSIAGFAVAVGRPASVTVEVRCAVALSDLTVPGMPGTREVSATATSPLDRFRGRS